MTRAQYFLLVAWTYQRREGCTSDQEKIGARDELELVELIEQSYEGFCQELRRGLHWLSGRCASDSTNTRLFQASSSLHTEGHSPSAFVDGCIVPGFIGLSLCVDLLG